MKEPVPRSPGAQTLSGIIRLFPDKGGQSLAQRGKSPWEIAGRPGLLQLVTFVFSRYTTGSGHWLGTGCLRFCAP